MPTLDKRKRDWPAALSLGFNIDRNGRRRQPTYTNILTLGLLLPGFALWGLYRAVTGPTSVGLWVLAVALYLVTLFGVTLGNHRYWTHRGFEARFPLQVVLAVASGMSMEGDIQQWVMNHRAHHRFADVVGRPAFAAWPNTLLPARLRANFAWGPGSLALLAYEGCRNMRCTAT